MCGYSCCGALDEFMGYIGMIDSWIEFLKSLGFEDFDNGAFFNNGAFFRGRWYVKIYTTHGHWVKFEVHDMHCFSLAIFPIVFRYNPKDPDRRVEYGWNCGSRHEIEFFFRGLVDEQLIPTLVGIPFLECFVKWWCECSTNA